MRHILLINIFLFSFLVAHEQTKFNNVSSRNKNDSVLYIGVENYIEISGIDPNAGKTSFNVTHGEINKIEGSKYLIRVNSQKPDTLEFYQNGHLSLKKVFTVQVIPYPIARLANYHDTTLSVAQIKLNPFLSVILPDCSYKHYYQIISFGARTISTGDTIPFTRIIGNHLSRDLLLAVEELSPNDKILFEDMIVTCPSCRNFRLRNLVIRIK